MKKMLLQMTSGFLQLESTLKSVQVAKKHLATDIEKFA
jgi:hypothetical protein